MTELDRYNPIATLHNAEDARGVRVPPRWSGRSCARQASKAAYAEFVYISLLEEPDHSGFPHKRHCDLRLAFSPLHLEQRLYIFPVNH